MTREAANSEAPHRRPGRARRKRASSSGVARPRGRGSCPPGYRIADPAGQGAGIMRAEAERRSPPRGKAGGEGEDVSTADTTLIHRGMQRCPQPLSISRAVCGSCGCRFPWPTGALLPHESPLISVMGICPRCHGIIELQPEPVDEVWWRFASSAPPAAATPPARQTCPARRPSAVRPAPKPSPERRECWQGVRV